jgi:tripartite-type tricarboxylate transporter receptor subunit TctC
VTLAAVASIQSAAADTFPSRALRIITPLAPGGAADQTARVVADKLKDVLGQAVIVEGRIGGGGVVAADYVLRQPGDGYTYLMHTVSMATAPTIYTAAKYDPIKDFVPVGTVNQGAMALAVNPDMPVKTVAEYVAYAKAHPGQINHGTSGFGALDHLGIELLMRSTGVKINVIPYKGGASVTPDLLAGRVQSQIDSLTTLRSQMEAGKVRILGVTGNYRIDGLPNIPTIAETIPGFDVLAWYGLYAPAGLPHDVLMKINHAITQVDTMPEVVERDKAMGYVPLTTTPEQHAAMLKRDMDKYVAILKELNIKM